ncbi:MAG: pectate lyase [Paludibacteraceae bacterium]|nr:pectate lyase [Paludibacteraceae bacterium]
MRHLLWLCCCVLTLVASAQDFSLPAFPGAEGFGKYTSGGRGGKVVYVTNLNDNGEGSLRWALQQYPNDPLTVLFAVSGEIRLESMLRINRKNYTIAGQSAPGLGIVITHHKVNFGGSENFIVRNLRFRIGQLSTQGDTLTQNAVGAENCMYYIFDHCDFGWSIEENMNSYDSHFITVQYCIVHEGLYNAGHPKGARGYGSQWGGSPASFHHNLLVHNNQRSCRFNGSQSNDYVTYIDYINNVVYNYGGGSNGCYGGENTANLAQGEYNGLNSVHECNMLNNYYRMGPNTTNSTLLFVMSSYARKNATSWGPSKWHLSGNVMDGKDALTQDNKSGFKSEKTYTVDQLLVDTVIRTATPWYRWTADSVYGRYDWASLAYAAQPYQTAEEALQTVLDTAGAFPRDHVEKRLVNDTRMTSYTFTGSKSRRKGVIDVETDAEGFYAYPEVTAAEDTDGDGMPDEWETAHGLNPDVPDQNTIAASGYTMLEEYLNGLMLMRTPMDDGWQPVEDALEEVKADIRSQRYNVLGQPVGAEYKGIVIRDGKKYY